MKKDALVKLVKSEAKNLRTNANKKEISKLNFESMNPCNSTTCIYGLMTQYCFSDRATSLIEKCAERVYVPNLSCHLGIASLTKTKLNGKPTINDYGRRGYNYFSPIECFIQFPANKTNGNNKRLIDYLKGKKSTLNFKPF